MPTTNRFSYPNAWGHYSTGGISLIVLCLFSASLLFFLYIWEHYSDIKTQSSLAKEKLVSIQEQQKSLSDFKQSVKKDKELLTLFSHKRFDQISTEAEIKSLLKTWKRQLKIQKIDISFDFSQPFKTDVENMKFSKTDVSLTLSLLSDRQFYTMMEKIDKELPGLAKIKSFTLKRVKPLTQDTVRRAASSKNSSLFEGQILLEWIHRTDK